MRFIPFLLGLVTGSLTYLNLTSCNSARAQITPDNTLGAESSVVTPNQIIKGIPSDRIDGGAIRAGNLFHSFTDFNIGSGQGAYLTNPSGIENILMRVTGNNVSQILGTLGVLGNANLFFVNPNGIVFGQNARLDVNGSFVGSAAQSFLLGNGLEFSATNPQAPPLLKINVPIGLQTGTNQGDIANAGNLAVNSGKNLTLFGSTVTSTGSLIAPGGTVQVLGEQVGLFDNALINVSANTGGGTVLIGGDLQGKGAVPNAQRIYIGSGVNINADAQTLGNGGSVIIFAEDTARIYGKISTRGGLLGGNGGFVETSGRQFLDITTTPNIQAPAGIGGNWLIDPNNIEIVADGSGNSNITPTNPFQTTGDTSQIEANVIVNALKSGNVTISTTEAGANSQVGDITLNTKLNFDGIGTGKTLTLNAHNNILINAPISDSNTLTTDSLNLVFNANSDRSGFGRVELVPILFTPGDSISTGGGDITIQGNGDTSAGVLTVVPINSGGGNISLTGTSTNRQGIFNISAINSAGGNITLVGDSNNAEGIFNVSSINSEGGNISLVGDSNNAEGIFHVSSLNSGNGDITLTADRNFITGTVTGSGNLLIQPLTPSLDLELGRNDIYPGATFLHDYELSRLTDGFAAITIGRADGSGTINLLGDVTFKDPVTLRSPVGNGNIIVNNSLLATGSLTLEAAKDIIFNNDASINAPSGTTTINTLSGDVVLGNYTGVSLKIETPGSITAQDIKITAPDTSLAASPNSDNDILRSSPALILRAGLSNLGEPTSSGKINVGSIDTSLTSPIPVGVPVSGPIILSAFGDITTGSINTTSASLSTGDSALNNSGSIFITSTAGAIDTSAGLLSTGARFNAQAGSIVLDAKKDIKTGNIFSGRNGSSVGGELKLISREGSIDTTAGLITSRGDGVSSGEITFNAAGDIQTNTIDSSGGSNGGAINLDAGGNVTTGAVSSSTFGSNDQYDGGAVTIKAQGNIITDSIITNGRIGGAVNLDAGGNITTVDINTYSRIGGAVNLDAGGNITTEDIITFGFGFGSDSNMIAKAGAIALTAGGDISTQFLSSYFLSNVTGDGGAIALTADGNISTKDLLSFSYSQTGNAGNGGAISFTSGGNIVIPSLNSFSYSQTGNAGNGGAIALSARNGNISGLTSPSSVLASVSVSDTGNAGAGGNVTLEAKNKISDLEILTLSSTSNSGEFQLTGFGDLSVINTNIITSKQLTINIPSLPPITLDVGGKGQSGNVNITSLDNLTFNNSRIESDTKGINPAGNVTINSPGFISFNDSKIISNTSSTGQAGNINLQAERGINLTGANSGLFAQTSNQGNAGIITLEAPLINLQQEAQISTSTTDIGKAGDILLNTDTLTLANGGQILAFTQGSGDGGTIRINAANAINVGEGVQDFSPIISVETSGTGKAGNIILETPNFTLSETARITATATATSTNAEGGGNITLNASKIDLAGIVGVFAETQGQAPAGRLILQPDNNKPTLDLTLAPGATISASTSASGNGGDLLVTAPQAINISGQGKLAVETTGTGNAGNIEITTEKLTLSDGVEISASTSSSGKAGDITFNTPSLTVANGGKIFASTTGNGDGGKITINAPNEVNLGMGVQDFAPILSVETSGAGKAGDIMINTPNLTVFDTARITATATKDATNLEGGGSIILNANNLNLAGIVGIVAETQGEAPAGSLVLKPYENNLNLNLNLFTGAKISASTFGSGNGGDLNITAPDTINISGAGILAVETFGSGNAGNIDISSQKLTLSDGVEISAATSSSGKGGSLTVNASEFALLQNQSRLLTQASGTGTAGDVTINTPELNLRSQAKISANTISSQGGDIQLQGLNTLKVNNSEISASTQTGKAGNLRVNAANSVELSAGALSVAATGKDGIAGNLTVNTGQFNLSNGAQVTVSSPQGQAGNVDITANSLSLNQGGITAETGNSGTESGANINLQISDWLQLKNESLISATANNTANGGNINIDTKFLIAFPPTGTQGSDIIANAEFGNGGRININAEGVFGIQFRQARTRFNDFTVSSEFGSSGQVEINTAIDPSVGLTELPSVPVEQQVSQVCKPQTAENQSQFIITGRGGLPANPYESLQTDSIIKKWVTVDNEQNTTDNSNRNIMTNHSPEAIVEAQGLIKSENGDIYLVAETPKVTPHSPTLTPVACSGSK